MKIALLSVASALLIFIDALIAKPLFQPIRYSDYQPGVQPVHFTFWSASALAVWILFHGLVALGLIRLRHSQPSSLDHLR